ncbi:UNVERIFIED_CONTAM: hypothetical protein Sindi_2212000 [Sesamum indicum]
MRRKSLKKIWEKTAAGRKTPPAGRPAAARAGRQDRAAAPARRAGRRPRAAQAGAGAAPARAQAWPTGARARAPARAQAGPTGARCGLRGPGRRGARVRWHADGRRALRGHRQGAGARRLPAVSRGAYHTARRVASSPLTTSANTSARHKCSAPNISESGGTNHKTVNCARGFRKPNCIELKMRIQ